MSDKKTKLVRIRESTLKKSRAALPSVKTDADRFDLIFNTSAVRVEGKLKEKDFLNNLGGFVFGKTNWKKIGKKG